MDISILSEVNSFQFITKLPPLIYINEFTDVLCNDVQTDMEYILTEGAQIEILVPCNSPNPCLPSPMLVVP